MKPKRKHDYCIRCQKNDDQAALIYFRQQGKDQWICAQCLPVLIHKPQEIGDKITRLV